jgi:hypothetical protein
LVHESVSLQPQSIPIEPFQIFSKIRGDIHKSSCTTGINDTGGKLLPVSTTPAARQIATGVNNTCGEQWKQLSDC